MIGPCFAMHYLVAFYFCNHLVGEEIAGCFTLIVFLLELLIVFGALCLFLTVSWVGLKCVIVEFPGHTYILRYITHDCFFSLSYFIYLIIVIFTFSH